MSVHAGVPVICVCMQLNRVNQPAHYLAPISLERTLASGQKKQTEELSGALFSPLVLHFTLCLTCAQAHKQTHAHICEVPEGDDEYPVWMDWIINNINENTNCCHLSACPDFGLRELRPWLTPIESQCFPCCTNFFFAIHVYCKEWASRDVWHMSYKLNNI